MHEQNPAWVAVNKDGLRFKIEGVRLPHSLYILSHSDPCKTIGILECQMLRISDMRFSGNPEAIKEAARDALAISLVETSQMLQELAEFVKPDAGKETPQDTAETPEVHEEPETDEEPETSPAVDESAVAEGALHDSKERTKKFGSRKVSKGRSAK